MLFHNQSKHKIQVPARGTNGAPINIEHLVLHICNHLMRDQRKELFVLDGSMYVSICTSRTEMVLSS